MLRRYGSIPFSKRLFDLLVASLVLIVTAPFIILAIVAIKINQTIRLRPLDPMLYSEIRYSHGSTFTLYKFNIFKYEQIVADREAGKFIHTKTYERNDGVTPIGWILKQIYMDELPQFFNVFIGQLSVVGPRPVNEEVYLQLIEAGIDDKSKVRAGITGHFQSQKNTPNSGAVNLDREYVEYCLDNQNYKIVLFDLKIIFKTLYVIFKAQGI